MVLKVNEVWLSMIPPLLLGNTSTNLCTLGHHSYFVRTYGIENQGTLNLEKISRSFSKHHEKKILQKNTFFLFKIGLLLNSLSIDNYFEVLICKKESSNVTNIVKKYVE